MRLAHKKTCLLTSSVIHLKQSIKRSSHLVSVKEESILDKFTIATISLDRPPVNSLSMVFVQQFNSAIRRIEESGQIDGVILKSSVPNIFSSGLDLSELCQTTPEQLKLFWKQVCDMWFSVYSSKLPTVAAINGHCLAGGAMIANACDYRIAVNGDYGMGIIPVKAGVIAPPFVTKSLAHLIGERQAELAILRGHVFSPDEAVAIGLVDELCDRSELQTRSIEALLPFLKVSQLSRSTMKMSVRREIIRTFQDTKEDVIEEFVRFVMQDSVQQHLGIHLEKLKRKN